MTVVGRILGRARAEMVYAAMRRPKRRGWIETTPEVVSKVRGQLESAGFDVPDLEIDVADYRSYIDRANYGRFEYYGRGKGPNFPQKSLEHYVASRLLDLGPDDVFIDVACASSPAPEIYEELFGCVVYRQDLIYPEGIHGNVIGGDAASMPIDAGFASAMALHCAFEHFEGDADTRLIREAARVLCTGGRLCVLPLYMNETYAIQTDTRVLHMGDVSFEPEAIVYDARNYGQRHGRFYDVDQLARRVGSHLGPLTLTIHHVVNAHEVDPSCYLRFAAVFEK